MPRPVGKITRRALGRIQRLCCLGLGSERIIPELMRELGEVIPSRCAGFRWYGPNSQLRNHYTLIPIPSLAALYAQEFYNSRELSVCRTPEEIFRNTPFRVVQNFRQDNVKVDTDTLLRSDYYNVILRPIEADEIVNVQARDKGRLLGSMWFGRATRDAPFATEDIKLLEMFGKFLAHGMPGAALEEEAFAESDDCALFIADLAGKIQHASARAQQLIPMALLPRLSPTSDWRAIAGPVPEIARLCRALAMTAAGIIGQPPPVLRRRNAWGEFVLRAYWLGPTDGEEQTRQIGVTIERRVPHALAVWRRVEQMPLTPPEKQLCLLLAREPSRNDLAEAMGLGASTVVTHLRSVHAKLGVHSRAELLAALQPG
jgi:DNA-binding CsgD family transcriptional regulator